MDRSPQTDLVLCVLARIWVSFQDFYSHFPFGPPVQTSGNFAITAFTNELLNRVSRGAAQQSLANEYLGRSRQDCGESVDTETSKSEAVQ